MIPAALIPFFVLAVKGELVGMYSQCGGENWTGATECESPATCYSQNPYYYQCTTLTTGADTENDTAATTTATTTAAAATTSAAIAASTLSTSVVAPAATTSTADDSYQEDTTYAQEDTTYAQEEATSAYNDEGVTYSSAAAAQEVTSAYNDDGTTTLENTATYADVASTQAKDVSAAVSSQADTYQATTSSSTSIKASTLSTVISSASSSSSADDDTSAISGGWSGTGVTTRYWDCCKPSCAWSGKSTSVDTPVSACDASGNVLTDYNVQSGCVGGTAYMCNDQSPWVVSDTLAYGFAAASVIGGTEDSMCCSCVKLTFTDQLVGKSMVVQITNTGTDLSSNHFDIALPGGGVGYYTDGCSSEFGSGYSWGDQYGGVTSESACSSLPSALLSGCEFRFGDWWAGADNPGVTFEQVVCPSELIAKTGCGRTDQ